LLRYGTGCTVLEPPELVALFSQTASGLAQIYGVSAEQGTGSAAHSSQDGAMYEVGE
jgi:hypothetical protein